MCKSLAKQEMFEKLNWKKTKAWKECEKKRKMKSMKRKRIGKQNKKRTKKVGTNGLEKKENQMNYSSWKCE